MRTRAEFVEAIEEGGVAAMEVLARDLKALGLMPRVRCASSVICSFAARWRAAPTPCAIVYVPTGSSGRSSPGSCACSCRADASGAGVLAKVLERYPVERIGEREAA